MSGEILVTLIAVLHARKQLLMLNTAHHDVAFAQHLFSVIDAVERDAREVYGFNAGVKV